MARPSVEDILVAYETLTRRLGGDQAGPHHSGGLPGCDAAPTPPVTAGPCVLPHDRNQHTKGTARRSS